MPRAKKSANILTAPDELAYIQVPITGAIYHQLRKLAQKKGTFMSRIASRAISTYIASMSK